MPIGIFHKLKTALVIYSCDRPFHLERLIANLYPITKIPSESVYFFCDSYRSSERYDDWIKTQKIVNSTTSAHGGNTFFAQQNMGLASSVFSGVSKVLESHESTIVLEDDLLLHPNFIDYHLMALEKYQYNLDVFQISGFTLKIKPPHENSCYFLPSVSTWGWSTWRRAWEGFSIDGIRREHPRPVFLERQAFDYYGAYSYSQMLESSLAGGNNSWGVLWNWYVFKKRGRVLYPPQSLVYNSGFDGSGVHCKQLSSDHWQWSLQEMNSARDVKKFAFPISKSSLSSQISRQADALIKIRMRDFKGLKNRLRYFYLRLRFRVIRLLLSPFLCISR
jgi:hypothetical protein